MSTSSHIDSKNIFGFWIYIMSDCIMFAALFATFAVLKNNLNGGLPPSQLFSMPYVLVETFLLLTSSFTYSLAILKAKEYKKKYTISLLALTFILGVTFLGMEINEFKHLVHIGAKPSTSGFLSAFFTLVGTHGLHVAGGLLWMLILLVQIIIHGITGQTRTKILCLGLFWHFLDIIWILVFTIVYLTGAI